MSSILLHLVASLNSYADETVIEFDVTDPEEAVFNLILVLLPGYKLTFTGVPSCSLLILTFDLIDPIFFI